jgi:hypothetical protein
MFAIQLSASVFTTRKPEKSNGITDGNIPSVMITDGHNSVSKSVGIYRRNIPTELPTEIFRRYIPSTSPTEYTFRLEIRNGMVMSGDFTDGKYRGIQTVIAVQ